MVLVKSNGKTDNIGKKALIFEGKNLKVVNDVNQALESKFFAFQKQNTIERVRKTLQLILYVFLLN